MTEQNVLRGWSPSSIRGMSYTEQTTVRRNIGRARQVRGRLGKLLRKEGENPIVAASFYQAVVQAVLLFGLETWVLTARMLQKLDGLHVDFLRKLAGMSACNMGVDTWQKEGKRR